MINALRLRLIESLFKDTTIVTFCSKDPYYVPLPQYDYWQLVHWKKAGKPHSPVWFS